jgi:DNA primase
MDEFEIIVETISEFLGRPKKIYKNHLQVSWNCPECDEDRNKGNLEVSLDKHVFHCWSCNISGALGKLFDNYGNKKHKKTYRIFKPEESKPIIKKNKKVKLPETYTLFKDSSLFYPIRKQAYNYLKNRGITEEIIEKYKIGFCDGGAFAGRIVIPSYDKNDELNYFIARSWDPNSRAKYKNPEESKDEIIFFENTINWNEDIHLCEGAFDAIFLPNSIAMLGKHMSELLLNTLYEKANGNIILCLDSDAFQDAVKLYHNLNGGRLYGKIKIIKLTGGADVADLRGNISDYFYTIK